MKVGELIHLYLILLFKDMYQMTEWDKDKGCITAFKDTVKPN